jgi:DNA-binding NtrC family response regulator
MSYRTGLHPSLDAELAELTEPIQQRDTRTVTEIIRSEHTRQKRIEVTELAIMCLISDLAPLVVSSGMKHKDFMLQVERAVFTAAMNEANGSPTRAARRLGMSHPRLTAALKARHPEIKRTPIKKRSVMKK